MLSYPGDLLVHLLPGHAVDRARVHAHDVSALFERSAFYAIATKQRWASPVVADVVAELAKR